MIIEKLDETIIETEEYGIKLLTYSISSPSPRVVTEEIENRDGHVELGTTFGGRKIRASFFMRSYDMLDYTLLRNEVFRLFMTKELFYLHDPKQKKRWLVRAANEFDIEKISPTGGKFEIEFISPSPYAESIGTTLDPLTFDAELWQIGQGLVGDDLIYRHITSSFRIYNAGDVTVDPRCFPLVISFKGASTNLKIKNNTTGDEWEYSGTTAAGDTIELNGIRSLKNGSSILSQTNRKLINLVPGWNDFTLTGATNPFEISFDFRFYYL